MSVIAGYGCKPVFQYKFRPLSQSRNRKPDGGFCIILYENGVLSFSTYAADGAFSDELCFSLSPQAISHFYSILRSTQSWLGDCPCDLRAAIQAHYASSFAFDGYNPIVIWEMNRLICEPTCSELGYFSRHIYVLFEDIASMLSKCGVHLSLDGFTWAAAKVHPFRKSQQPQYYTTGRQGVV